MLGVSESDFAKLEKSKSIPAPRMLAGREKYLRVDIKKAARSLPKATAKKPRGQKNAIRYLVQVAKPLKHTTAQKRP